MWLAFLIFFGIIVIFLIGFFVGVNNSGKVRKYKNALNAAPTDVKAWAARNGL
jgi:hypothetical protein